MHPSLSQAEHETISAFLELVVKLNETTFKPFFRKLYDWAFTQESGKKMSPLPSPSKAHTEISHEEERKRAVFCRVYSALLDHFKALMTPYMSFMIQAFTDLLESFSKSEDPDPELWSSLIQLLGKSFEVDEAGTIFNLFSIPPPILSNPNSPLEFFKRKKKKQRSGVKTASNKSPYLSSPKSPSSATPPPEPQANQTAGPSSQTLSALSREQ